MEDTGVDKKTKCYMTCYLLTATGSPHTKQKVMHIKQEITHKTNN